MTVYSSSATSLDLARKLDPPRWSDDLPACDCQRPSDNDQGVCMGCGRWINYAERDQP
jgi:hypothetical protein